MADDELFENLDDFGDLDEEPSFGLVEDEFPLDLMEPEPEGLSRTFKIVGALMALAVLAIIIVLVYITLGDQDKLTPSEKTSTAVAQLNQTIEAEYNATLEALAAIEAATQTAVYNAELTATAEFFVRQTEQAIAATDAAQTATAEFVASRALSTAQAATQEALNQSLTATAEANRLIGIVIDEQGTIFGNVTLKLYRDDGDGIFTPADHTPAPAQAPAGTTTLAYNEPVEGTLEVGQTVTWRFSGAAGDAVTIDAVAAAEGLETGFHIHAAEGIEDVEDSLRKSGRRVIHRLHAAGILGPRSIVAHAVHVDESEMEVLADTGTWVTHQPRSNMNNAVGVGRVERLLAHGVKVALGNDGFSNNMFAEMKAAYLVHKLAQQDPRAMPGDLVFRLAFDANAQLARLFWPQATLGVLEPGATADLILVDYHPITPLNAGNLPWHFLFGYEASMITTTISAGRVLMRDRQVLTLDEEEITARSRELAAKLWQRAL